MSTYTEKIETPSENNLEKPQERKNFSDIEHKINSIETRKKLLLGK